MKYYKNYKTEIKLTKEQKRVLLRNKHAQHWIWNLFIKVNEGGYKNNYKYMKAGVFLRWFNNEFLRTKEGVKYSWMKDKDILSINLQNTVKLCDRAYQEFFEKKRNHPKFKKFENFKLNYYFTRYRKDQPIKCCRHKIKIPIIGWVTLKEKGYLPYTNNEIISGTILQEADRYFVSVKVEISPCDINESSGDIGLGIDLGVKDFMTCSNGLVFPNINKSPKVKKLEKSLNRQQRALSRKQKAQKEEKREYKSNNYRKNQLKIQKLYYRLTCIRKAYVNKCIDLIIELRPKYITLENLNVKGLLRNKHISKSIKDSNFYYTKQVIIQKCNKHGIEVREVDRFFPSSKICTKCGNIKKKLKLSERIYKCESCGLELDRDLNASINLKKAKDYKILTTEYNSIKPTDGLSGSNVCEVLHQTVVPKREAGHKEAKRSLVCRTFLDKSRNLSLKNWCYKFKYQDELKNVQMFYDLKQEKTLVHWVKNTYDYSLDKKEERPISVPEDIIIHKV